MTVGEACNHFGVTEKTIRRWIHSKRIDAHKNEDGRWSISIPPEQPDNDQTDVQTTAAGLVDQLHSEIAHLRDQLSTKDDQLSTRDTQIDQLNKLLAMTSAQNNALTEKLPPPRQSIFAKFKSIFPRLPT